ncbi:MAG: LegC family aminotransferase [Candidatus Omnitrophota bacterium]
MKTAIPLSVPCIRGNEWKYIKECLDTGWVSYVGSYVKRFEDKVAGYCHAKYAVATVNGTCALHISLLACGVQLSDEVIVPALTFVATANAVKYCGAEPLFMDCASRGLGLDPEKTGDFLKKKTVKKRDGFTYNRDSGNRIKAIIPVHIFGHPVDMDAINGVCAGRNIDVIEDATESLGSEYKNKKTGILGKVGCLSFNGNKIITTGGGGMALTDNFRLAEKIGHLTTQARVGFVEYDHDAIGFNYRLSNINAAMGLAQMEKLEEYVRIKRANANLYKILLSEVDDVEFLWEELWAKSNFWFYTIKVAKDRKKGLMEYLLSKGIQVRPIWRLINTLPMYKKCQAYEIERSQEAYETCLNVPCSVGLKRDEIVFVTRAIKEYFSERPATRKKLSTELRISNGKI